mgnify:CR=1 FL=1
MSDQEVEIESKEERRAKLLQNLAKGRATRLENIKKKKTSNVVQEVSCRFCGKSYKSVQYKDKHELICKKTPSRRETRRTRTTIRRETRRENRRTRRENRRETTRRKY